MNEDTSKKKQFTSLAWTLLGNVSTQTVGFVVSIFLARLLEPEEFGIVGMAMVFISLLHLLVDSGFSTGLIQQKEEDTSLYDAVFSFNLFISLILLAGFWLMAPAIARFYEEPVVEPLVRMLALSLPINASGIVHRVILERRLLFKELGVRLFVSGALSGILGVVLAFKGFGVYALAFQLLAASALNSVMLWMASPWRPGVPRSFAGLKQLTHYSKYVFFGSALNRALNEGNALVIGKLFSPATLGFYTRANSLNLLVARYTASTVAKVYLPVLSKLQDEKERFEELYLKVIGNTTGLTFLLSGLLIICAEVLIVGLFGEKWLPSVLIFQIIMLKIFAFPISSIIVNAYLARGMAKRNFQLSLCRITFRLLPFVVAYFYGFSAFLYCVVLVSIGGLFFNLFFVSKDLEVSLRDQILAMLNWTRVFIVAVVPVLILQYYYGNIFGEGLLERTVTTSILMLMFFGAYVAQSLQLNPELKKYTSEILRKIRTRLAT